MFATTSGRSLSFVGWVLMFFRRKQTTKNQPSQLSRFQTKIFARHPTGSARYSELFFSVPRSPISTRDYTHTLVLCKPYHTTSRVAHPTRTNLHTQGGQFPRLRAGCKHQAGVSYSKYVDRELSQIHHFVAFVCAP